MIVEYSARSHVGRVRESNEDNLYVDGIVLPPDARERPFAIDGCTYPSAIFAICDGMGGEENGEIASLLAVQTLLNINERIKSTAPEQLSEEVWSYVNIVNEKIHAEINRCGKRMGTTLALVMAAKNGIHCFNIGDSRIYCLQRTVFEQITNDHTLAAEQKRNGYLIPYGVKDEKSKNKLTRCIGIGDILPAENYPPIFGSCRILICSDGLTDMVSISEIENVLCASERAADAANVLLDLALGNGGKDNVTLIVMDVKDSKKHLFGRFAKKLKEWSRA